MSGTHFGRDGQRRPLAPVNPQHLNHLNPKEAPRMQGDNVYGKSVVSKDSSHHHRRDDAPSQQRYQGLHADPDDDSVYEPVDFSKMFDMDVSPIQRHHPRPTQHQGSHSPQYAVPREFEANDNSYALPDGHKEIIDEQAAESRQSVNRRPSLSTEKPGNEAGVDPSALLANAKGLHSLRAIHGLSVSSPLHPTPYTLSLTSLSAHMNNIQTIDGLEGCVNLRYLDLSGNQITCMSSGGVSHGQSFSTAASTTGLVDSERSPFGGLRALRNLEYLNLSSNRLRALEDLEFLPKLVTLIVAFNNISSLDGLLLNEEDRFRYRRRNGRLVESNKSQGADERERDSQNNNKSGTGRKGEPPAFRVSLGGGGNRNASTDFIGNQFIQKVAWDSKVRPKSGPSFRGKAISSRDSKVAAAVGLDDGARSLEAASLLESAIPNLRVLDLSANDLATFEVLEPLYSAPSLQDLRLKHLTADAHTRPSSSASQSSLTYQPQPFTVRENPVCFVQAPRGGLRGTEEETDTYRSVVLRNCPFLLSLDGQEVGYVPTPLKRPVRGHRHDSCFDSPPGDENTSYKDTLLQHQQEQYRQRLLKAHRSSADSDPASRPSTGLPPRTSLPTSPSVLPSMNLMRRSVSCLVHPSKIASNLAPPSHGSAHHAMVDASTVAPLPQVCDTATSPIRRPDYISDTSTNTDRLSTAVVGTQTTVEAATIVPTSSQPRDELLIRLRDMHLEERHSLEAEIGFLKSELSEASEQLRSAAQALSGVDARVAREVAVAKESKQKQIKMLSEQVCQLIKEAKEMSERCSHDVCSSTTRHQEELSSLRRRLEKEATERCEAVSRECWAKATMEMEHHAVQCEIELEGARLASMDEPHFRHMIEREEGSLFLNRFVFLERAERFQLLEEAALCRENALSISIESLTQKLHDAAAKVRRLDVERKPSSTQTEGGIKPQTIGVASQTQMCGMVGMFKSWSESADLIPSHHLRDLSTRLMELDELCGRYAQEAHQAKQQLASAASTHESQLEMLRAENERTTQNVHHQCNELQHLLDVTVEDRDRKLAAHEESSREYQRTIDNLKASIERHDEELSQIELDASAKINEKRETISNLEATLEEKEVEVEQLRKKVAALEGAALTAMTKDRDITGLRDELTREVTAQLHDEFQSRFEILWENKAAAVNRQIDAQWEAREQQFIVGPRQELLDLIAALRNHVKSLEDRNNELENERGDLLQELVPSLRAHIVRQDDELRNQRDTYEKEIAELKERWSSVQALILQTSSTKQ